MKKKIISVTEPPAPPKNDRLHHKSKMGCFKVWLNVRNKIAQTCAYTQVCNFWDRIKVLIIYIYIYIYIYICMSSTDRLFRCIINLRCGKTRRTLEAKPAQLYFRLSILQLSQQANHSSCEIIKPYVVTFVCLHFTRCLIK